MINEFSSNNIYILDKRLDSKLRDRQVVNKCEVWKAIV